MHINIVISHFVNWNSLSPLNYYVSQRTKNKYKKHKTFKIPEPGNATSQSVITAAEMIGLLTIYGIRNTWKKLPVRTWVGRGRVW
jgi:hypothetical protein